MAKVSDVQPTRAETWLEAHFHGYRYGWVLVLLSITFVFMAVGSPDAWARVVTVALQGLTLLAALVASRAGRRLSRIAALVVTIAWRFVDLVARRLGFAHSYRRVLRVERVAGRCDAGRDRTSALPSTG